MLRTLRAVQLTPRYTKEQLEKAIAESTNLRQVCLKLGLAGRGANYQTLRRWIKELALDTSHFSNTPSRPAAVQRSFFCERPTIGRQAEPAPFTVEDVRVAAASSYSLASAARKLGLSKHSGAYKVLRRIIEQYDIDISHFTGKSWIQSGGIIEHRATPLEEILVADRPYSSAELKRRLIDEGLKDATCESCGRELWQDVPIPLELHHANGDSEDNRLDNLKLLCPNCHALTDNYRGRNIGRR